MPNPTSHDTIVTFNYSLSTKSASLVLAANVPWIRLCAMMLQMVKSSANFATAKTLDQKDMAMEEAACQLYWRVNRVNLRKIAFSNAFSPFVHFYQA